VSPPLARDTMKIRNKFGNNKWTEYTGKLVKNYTGKLVKIRPIMDIGGWLRSLGLEEYETAFRENKINERVLPSLTAEDLKELGVRALGDRRILLNAIAALGGDVGAQSPTVAAAPALPSTTTPISAPIAEAIGERRHVTVMFCDLVGSTGISASLDAEDWRDLVGGYLDAASAAVTEMGGHVGIVN